jgi:hypothetical protein
VSAYLNIDIVSIDLWPLCMTFISWVNHVRNTHDTPWHCSYFSHFGPGLWTWPFKPQSAHRVAIATFRSTFMMKKLDQPGEGGWCTPTPFHYIYHHIQSWEGRYTPPISTLPQCVLCASNNPPLSFQHSWALELITSSFHRHPKRKRPLCALCSFYTFKLTIFFEAAGYFIFAWELKPPAPLLSYTCKLQIEVQSEDGFKAAWRCYGELIVIPHRELFVFRMEKW